MRLVLAAPDRPVTVVIALVATALCAVLARLAIAVAAGDLQPFRAEVGQ